MRGRLVRKTPPAVDGRRSPREAAAVRVGEQYERDNETGLDFAQARYYGSAQGRFTSPDPLMASAGVSNPQTFNRYAYVLNNPGNSTDPTGMVLNHPFNGDGPDDDGRYRFLQSPTPAPQQQEKVEVQAKVIEDPKIVQNEKQPEGDSATGVRGIIQDLITVNGKPLSGVRVDEKNVSKVTLNGKEKDPARRERSDDTNDAGQINDTVGLMAPAQTAEQDKPLIQALNTRQVTVVNTNTIFFTTPGGTRYSATAKRTLTNVGEDGKASSHYTLKTTQPVVTIVKQ